MRVFDQAGLHGRAQRRGVERAREKARVILEADTRPGFSEGAQSTLAERRAGCIGAKRKADVESTKRRWRPGLAARARGPRGTPASRRFPYTRVRPIACASSSIDAARNGLGEQVQQRCGRVEGDLESLVAQPESYDRWAAQGFRTLLNWIPNCAKLEA